MKISLVLCTLGTRVEEIIRLIDSLENQTYKNFEVIVVSQDNHTLVANLFKDCSFVVRIVNLQKKGLSYARNQGKKYLSGDIYSFSDDDCWYPPNALEDVFNVFCSEENHNIIVFKIYDPLSKKYYKDYTIRKQAIRLSDIGKCSSIEIFIKKDSFNFKVDFDENFGLGARYNSSEENIYLYDMINANQTINTIDKVVVYHKVKEHSVLIFDYKRLETAYNYFVRINKKYPYLYFILFCVKHFKKINNKIDVLKVRFK